MNKKKVKISVIIRTYNSAGFIKNAIESVKNQTLNKDLYEVVIVDDGSSDNTLGILERYYKNEIRLVKQKHLGPVKATNAGIIKSRGEYIILLDDDDAFEPNVLREMLDVFNKEKSVDFVYCDYLEETGENKKVVSLKKNIFNSLAGGIMFKKKLFSEIGLFDENLIFTEYDFLIKLRKIRKIGSHIAKPLYIYKRNKESLTFNKERVVKGLKQLEKKYGKIVKKIRKY